MKRNPSATASRYVRRVCIPAVIVGCAVLAAFPSAAQQASPDLVIDEPAGPRGAGAMDFGGNGRWLAALPQVPEAPLKVRVLDVETGKLLQTVSDADHKPISILRADPRRDRLALGLQNGAVVMIDVASGRELWRVQAPAAPKNTAIGISALRFSSDGSRLLGLMSATLAARFRMPKPEITFLAWNAETGAPVETRELSYNVQSFCQDDRMGVATIRGPKGQWQSALVDLETGRQVGPEFTGVISSCHAGARRAFAGWFGNSQLVDLDSGKPIAADLAGGLGGTLAPDGKTVVVTGQQFGWRLLDAATGVVRFAGGPALPITTGQIAFAPDGARFAFVQMAPIIVDMSDPSHYRSLSGDAMPVVSAGAAQSATSGNSEALQSWTATALNAAKRLGGPALTTPSASFSTDGRWLIARSLDGELDFFDAATGNRVPFRIPTNAAEKQPPISAAALGRYVYVRSEMKQQQETMKAQLTTPGVFYTKNTKVVDQTVTQGAFSTDVVDTQTGRVVQSMQFKNVTCISGGGEFAVEFTTTNKGVGIATLKSAEGKAIADLIELGLDLTGGCSISHNGRYIVVSSERTKASKAMGLSTVPGGSFYEMMYGTGFGMRKAALEIYDVNARKPVASLQDSDNKPGHFPFIASSVQWTADDRLLLAGGGMESLKRGPVRIFDAASGHLLHSVPNSETVMPLELAPDGSEIVTSIELPRTYERYLRSFNNFGVKVLDVNSGEVRYTLPDASAEPAALVFSPSGKTIVGPSRNGVLGIWARSDGKLIGELRALQEGEWLVHSPGGLFDGSPRAWSLISWHDSDKSLDASAPEIYFNEYYRPGLLANLLEGRAIQPAKDIANIDRRQPTVTVSAGLGPDGSAALLVTAQEAGPAGTYSKGSGVRDLRLFRNGQLIKAWRGPLSLDANGKASFALTAPAIAGENRFSAYAFNSDNIKSKDALSLVKAPGAPRPGVAYVVSIGVNQYANPDRKFTLRYAVADAESLAEQFLQRQKELAQFSAVKTVVLRDQEATGANIRRALKRLAGENPGPLPAGAPAALETLNPVRPEDTLVVYFAGHGISDGDRFYLVPHDLGYAGPKAEIGANVSKVLEHSISDRDLEQALEPIGARHIILIIDACQSGQALESDDERRGPMNSRGLAQLAWEKGISVLAASQAYQSAIESDDYSHGYLTFALAVEALAKPVADSTPADGLITESEWLEYAARRVPQLQIASLEKARTENRVLTYEALPEGKTSSRLQSPRLFTPRDVSGEPLIVAKFK